MSRGEGVERLFVYGRNPSPSLAVSDLTSFVLSPVGAVTPDPGVFPVDTQGDAFGTVYALAEDGTFFEVDSTTAQMSHLAETGFANTGDWAVMAYGDQVYFFGDSSIVGRYDPEAGQLTTAGTLDISVIGASAAPCVP